jgi:acetolactate synthase regulatory subunit
MADMRALGALSNAARTERSVIRRQLRMGETSLSVILRDPPQPMAKDPLFDVLKWVRHRGHRWLIDVNRRAILEGVNLAVPLGQASERSRRWLVEEIEGEQW